MGILVSDHEIITCAHVINLALGWRGQEAPANQLVGISFPYAEGYYVEGRVDGQRWYPRRPESNEPSDVAIIVLDQAPPANVGKAVLLELSEDIKLSVYGFRGEESNGQWQSHGQGERVLVEHMGPLPGGRIQLDGLRADVARVEPGFSGAAVYDSRHDIVLGMVVESDRTRDISQCIDVPTLRKALGTIGGISSVLDSSNVSSDEPRSVPHSVVARTDEKKKEIENYLCEIAELLPKPDADEGFLGLLKTILHDDNAGATRLRPAFGFPKGIEQSRLIFSTVSLENEPSVRLFVNALAQRIYHILWRYEATLKLIGTEWSSSAMSDSAALRSLFEDYLIARKPTLEETSAALKFTKDLQAISEVAPDPTLYAVLRALEPDKEAPLWGAQNEQAECRKSVVDFLYQSLKEILEGAHQIDDSSNAWWAVRTGIDEGDVRFSDLLPKVVDKFSAALIPLENVTRFADVPEIYKAIRTKSYTLSNVQAILEKAPNMKNALKERLHGVINNMLESLLSAGTSRHLYLASVHHEGLRNYLDYVKNQKLLVRGSIVETATEEQPPPQGDLRDLLTAFAIVGTGAALTELGTYLAKQALNIRGFANVRKIEERERLTELKAPHDRISYGTFLAERAGSKFVIQVVTRRKYSKNRELNSRYILVRRERSSEISDNPSIAEKHFGAKPYWLAVTIDNSRHSIYLGSVKQLQGQLGIPMKDVDLANYECLVDNLPIAPEN
jgi:hypothetical protein